MCLSVASFNKKSNLVVRRNSRLLFVFHMFHYFHNYFIFSLHRSAQGIELNEVRFVKIHKTADNVFTVIRRGMRRPMTVIN